MATLVHKTIGTDGAESYDYASVAAWEADNWGATGGDLVSNDETVYGEIKGTWASAEGSIILNASATAGYTDATHKVVLEATGSARAGSVWNSSAWSCESTVTAATVSIQDITLLGLQFKTTGTGSIVSTTGSAIVTANVVWDSCIFDGNGTSVSGFWPNCGSQTSGAVVIQSSIVYGIASNGYAIRGTHGSRIHVLSCSIINSYRGIYLNAGSGCIAENNIIHDKGTAISGISGGAIAQCNSNATSDTTADDFGGFNNRINQTFTFRNAAGGDYRLAKTDLGAFRRGKKVDGIDTDIDGNTITNYSIGADDGYTDADCTVLTPTIAASGGDYPSLAAADSDDFGATSGDLVANDEIVKAEINGAWASAEASAVTLDCFTTGDMLRRLEITCADDGALHDGKWTDTAYRIEVANTGLTVTSPFVELIGIQVAPTGAGSKGILCYTSTQNVYFQLKKCIIKGDSTNSRYGIQSYGNGSYLCEVLIRQCISYNHTYSTDGSGFVVSTIDAIIENCLAYGCDYGIWGSGTLNGDVQSHIINCICDTNGTTDVKSNGYFDTLDHNASSDTTAQDYSATNSRISQNPLYINEGSDFHLDPTDSSLIDYGLDLSEYWARDGIGDIDGEARSGLWDIGPDEYILPVIIISTTKRKTFLPISKRYFPWFGQLQDNSGYTIRPVVMETTSADQDALSRIIRAYQVTQEAVSRVVIGSIDNQEGLSRLVNLFSNNQDGFSRLIKPIIESQDGFSRLTKLFNNSQDGFSRLNKSFNEFQDGLSQLIKSSNQFQDGISIIKKEVSYNQDGTAQITVSFFDNIDGSTRIEATSIVNQDGTSLISFNQISNIDGLTRLTGESISFIDGDSRLIGTTYDHKEGISRIVLNGYSTQDAISRITKAFSGNISGLANLIATIERPLDGITRITTGGSITNIDAISKILKSFTYSQDGIAKIVAGFGSSNIEAISRIIGISYGYIDGIAKIEPITAVEPGPIIIKIIDDIRDRTQVTNSNTDTDVKLSY